ALPILQPLRPLLLAHQACIAGAPTSGNGLRNLEGRVRPAQVLAGGGDLVLAQGGAVGGLLALLVRRAEADGGAAADQGRAFAVGLGGADGLGDLLRVMAVHLADDLPAIGLEAGGGVVGEPAAGVAVDGNAVVVPEADQLAQAPSAGQGGSLVRNAF